MRVGQAAVPLCKCRGQAASQHCSSCLKFSRALGHEEGVALALGTPHGLAMPHDAAAAAVPQARHRPAGTRAAARRELLWGAVPAGAGASSRSIATAGQAAHQAITHRRMEVFPAPDGPMMSTLCPGVTVKFRSATSVAPLDGTRSVSPWMSSRERPGERRQQRWAQSGGAAQVVPSSAGTSVLAHSPEEPGRSVMLMRSPSPATACPAAPSGSSTDDASATGSTVAVPPLLRGQGHACLGSCCNMLFPIKQPRPRSAHCSAADQTHRQPVRTS